MASIPSAVTGLPLTGGTLSGNLIVSGTTFTQALDCNLAGAGLAVKEGANAKQGTATLAAGTVVVSNTSVTANSRIMITGQSLGTVTVFSAYGVSARTAGTSFTILASQV